MNIPALVRRQEDVAALALHQRHHVSATVEVRFGDDAGHAKAAVHALRHSDHGHAVNATITGQESWSTPNKPRPRSHDVLTQKTSSVQS